MKVRLFSDPRLSTTGNACYCRAGYSFKAYSDAEKEEAAKNERSNGYITNFIELVAFNEDAAKLASFANGAQIDVVVNGIKCQEDTYKNRDGVTVNKIKQVVTVSFAEQSGSNNAGGATDTRANPPSAKSLGWVNPEAQRAAGMFKA